MEFEMSEGLTDLKQDIDRQLYWSGNSTLATVSAAATASTVITVTGRESVEAGNKFLDVGVIIDIVSGGVVTNSGITIAGISGTVSYTHLDRWKVLFRSNGHPFKAPPRQLQ